MNKKALQDSETIEYKMDKQEPIGSSHTIYYVILLIFICAIAISFFCIIVLGMFGN